MYFDVQEFQAADGAYSHGTVPMEAGFGLFSTARTLIRAAASTARSSKAWIGGNYGKAATMVADRARFGHTIEGSYVVPLHMPLDRPSEAPGAKLQFEGQGVTHPLIEPEERRTTRTLAQALSAIQNGVVQRASQPTGSVIADLVTAGVSREMVLALEKMVSTPGVAELKIRFEWAGAFEPPPGQLSVVVVPHESVEVLQRTAEKLVPSARTPYETLSGQIIDLEDDPERSGGRATIRTIRRSRQVRIDIPLSPAQTAQSHEWFRDHRHIVVTGVVKGAPGHTSWVTNIQQLAPLDEVILFDDRHD